jgi:hypothetical protein
MIDYEGDDSVRQANSIRTKVNRYFAKLDDQREATHQRA